MDKNENDDDNLQALPGFMPIKKAANILGLSISMVHQYVRDGRLEGFKASNVVMIREEAVENFQRARVGRQRTRVPVWRIPIGSNLQYLTIIFARLREGKREQLEQKLEEIHAAEKHLLTGTVARYIARNRHKPDDLQIVLVWRSTVMPSDEEREAALNALREELAEIVDWETAWSEEGQVLMHT
jgi:hypothetical protein